MAKDSASRKAQDDKNANDGEEQQREERRDSLWSRFRNLSQRGGMKAASKQGDDNVEDDAKGDGNQKPAAKGAVLGDVVEKKIGEDKKEESTPQLKEEEKDVVAEGDKKPAAKAKDAPKKKEAVEVIVAPVTLEEATYSKERMVEALKMLQQHLEPEPAADESGEIDSVYERKFVIKSAADAKAVVKMMRESINDDVSPEFKLVTIAAFRNACFRDKVVAKVIMEEESAKNMVGVKVMDVWNHQATKNLEHLATTVDGTEKKWFHATTAAFIVMEYLKFIWDRLQTEKKVQLVDKKNHLNKLHEEQGLEWNQRTYLDDVKECGKAIGANAIVKACETNKSRLLTVMSSREYTPAARAYRPMGGTRTGGRGPVTRRRDRAVGVPGRDPMEAAVRAERERAQRREQNLRQARIAAVSVVRGQNNAARLHDEARANAIREHEEARAALARNNEALSDTARRLDEARADALRQFEEARAALFGNREAIAVPEERNVAQGRGDGIAAGNEGLAQGDDATLARNNAASVPAEGNVARGDGGDERAAGVDNERSAQENGAPRAQRSDGAAGNNLANAAPVEERVEPERNLAQVARDNAAREQLARLVEAAEQVPLFNVGLSPQEINRDQNARAEYDANRAELRRLAAERARRLDEMETLFAALDMEERMPNAGRNVQVVEDDFSAVVARAAVPHVAEERRQVLERALRDNDDADDAVSIARGLDMEEDELLWGPRLPDRRRRMMQRRAVRDGQLDAAHGREEQAGFGFLAQMEALEIHDHFDRVVRSARQAAPRRPARRAPAATIIPAHLRELRELEGAAKLKPFSVSEGLELVAPSPDFDPEQIFIKRITACVGWACHGLIFEFVDGSRSGTLLVNPGEKPMKLTDKNLSDRACVGWTDIEYGDYVVGMSGDKLAEGVQEWFCYSLTVHFASGLSVNYEANHEPWRGEPFSFDVPTAQPCFVHRISFRNDQKEDMLGMVTSIHLPMSRANFKHLPRKQQRAVEEVLEIGKKVDLQLEYGGRKPMGEDVWWLILGFLCGWELLPPSPNAKASKDGQRLFDLYARRNEYRQAS